MAEYDKGDLVRLSAEFKNDSSVLTDPTSVTVRIKHKAEISIIIYAYGVDNQLVRDAVGKYHVDFTPTLAGIYYYRWEGAGLVQQQEESSFTIRKSKIV